MARPIYPHELLDPDFQWLISTYKESNQDYLLVEQTNLPVLLVRVDTVLLPDPASLPVPVIDPNRDDLADDLAEDGDL